ncbi:MAG: hypothetical protein L6R37_001466 [Teloschistes peruensis]|nr:MAG: hypothetical protein L6R37_001466 [Teloschistes peruensis]
MLLARINEKKAELEDLRQLRDLSANMAAQVQKLEERLSTLSNGAEAVAIVLSNWHTVLQAINMASVSILKPKSLEGGDATEISPVTLLPQPLVRIPVEQEQLQPEPAADQGKEA